jgi:hypothetical protein
MTTEGGPEEQKNEVAKVAATLFGVPVEPGNVIGETLERITDPAALSPQALRDRVQNPVPLADYAAFAADPLATWIEEVFGFEPGVPAKAPPHLYLPVAARYFAITSLGIRPRSLTSMPSALAHSRISVLLIPSTAVFRPLRAAGRVGPPALRAAAA